MKQLVIISSLLILIASCTPGRSYTLKYYNDNKTALNGIRDLFQDLYDDNAFSIEFKDKDFNLMSFEMWSDTFRFIYNFDLTNKDLADTLDKYRYNTAGIVTLLDEMRRIKCTWISNLDYYENKQRKNLVFVSVRHNRLESFFNGNKYYALAFFREKQFFDSKNRLTDKSQKTRMREINGEIFHKITDYICYSITGNFR